MISYGRHSINEDDITEVIKTLKSNWLTTGPRIMEFESALEKYTGSPTFVVNSGTAALHCAFAAIDLKKGDEVITPPMTFIATQATAAQFGAKIVFADVFLETGNINPAEVVKVITPKTRAIVAVDYAGHPADLDELKEIAKTKGLYLIEDAAHSFGSRYRGKRVGSIADITTFSFFPTKNITTGEGGAVSSIDKNLFNKAKLFARQGITKEPSSFLMPNEGEWHQEVQSFGLNYRLSDIACALGISQLKRFKDFQESRNNIFEKYGASLGKLNNIKLPEKKEFVDPFWHLYSIQVEPKIRKEFYEFMHSRRIKVQVNYLPAHLHPVFRKLGFKEGDFPISERFYRGEISLPIYHGLTAQEQESIIESIFDFYKVRG